MVSTVTARPNHYEILGVTPAATNDEIRRAFAREISALRPRAFGGVGEVRVAYETLRHPDRRKAYDASIGIRPEPKPVSAAIAGVGAASFVSPTLGARLERLASEDFRPVSQRAAQRPRTESVPEPRTASFIASSVRSTAKAVSGTDVPTVSPSQSDQPTARPHAVEPLGRPETRLRPEAIPRDSEKFVHPTPQRVLDVDETAFDWTRPAAIAGGLVLAVGLLGAWAGWEAGNDVQAEQLPQKSVTQTLPPRPKSPVQEEVAIAPHRDVGTANPVTAKSQETAEAREEPKAPAPQYVALAEEPAGIARSADLAPEPTGLALAGAEQDSVVPATLPLPHSVVARTIGRIGYSCGQVASASPVDGQTGVFKVTCTSGELYRAAPVRGRYHFSRWSRN